MKAAQTQEVAPVNASKIVLFVLLAFLLFAAAALEAANWIRVYGTDRIDDYGRGAPTSDGGFVLYGRTGTTEPEVGIPILLKLDAHGELQWHNIYSVSGHSGSLPPWALQPTSDGGFVMSGAIGYAGDPGDLFLMKLDGDGQVTWAFAYGGAGTLDGQDNRANVVELPGGGFAAAVVYNVYGADAAWLLIVDEDGAVVSNHLYTRTGYSFAPYELQRTTDGGFVLAGSSAPDGQAPLSDLLVVKVNSAGVIQWQKIYAVEGWDAMYSGVHEVPGGGDLVVAGTLNWADGWAARVDGSTGEIVWQNTYGAWMAGHPQFNAEGHFVAASKNKVDNCGGLIGIDADTGGLLWQSGFSLQGGFNWLEPLPDGGFFATGQYGSAGNWNLWALKLNDYGQLGSSCSLDCTMDIPVAEGFLEAVDPGFEPYSATIRSVALDVAASTTTVSSSTICVGNEPPVCTAASPSPARLWPADQRLVPIAILGVTDPDGDSVTIAATAVTQDEPVKGPGYGDQSPDAFIETDGSVRLRAERSGKGNGRVYQIAFTADDGLGGTCSGTVKVCVPRDRNGKCKDDGQSYNSLVP